jgi:hypothetical protein
MLLGQPLDLDHSHKLFMKEEMLFASSTKLVTCKAAMASRATKRENNRGYLEMSPSMARVAFIKQNQEELKDSTVESIIDC